MVGETIYAVYEDNGYLGEDYDEMIIGLYSTRKKAEQCLVNEGYERKCISETLASRLYWLKPNTDADQENTGWIEEYTVN